MFRSIKIIVTLHNSQRVLEMTLPINIALINYADSGRIIQRRSFGEYYCIPTLGMLDFTMA